MTDKRKDEIERDKAIEGMNALIRLAKLGTTSSEQSEQLFQAVTTVQTYILKSYAQSRKDLSPPVPDDVAEAVKYINGVKAYARDEDKKHYETLIRYAQEKK